MMGPGFKIMYSQAPNKFTVSQAEHKNFTYCIVLGLKEGLAT